MTFWLRRRGLSSLRSRSEAPAARVHGHRGRAWRWLLAAVTVLVLFSMVHRRGAEAELPPGAAKGPDLSNIAVGPFDEASCEAVLQSIGSTAGLTVVVPWARGQAPAHALTFPRLSAQEALNRLCGAIQHKWQCFGQCLALRPTDPRRLPGAAFVHYYPGEKNAERCRWLARFIDALARDIRAAFLQGSPIDAELLDPTAQKALVSLVSVGIAERTQANPRRQDDVSEDVILPANINNASLQLHFEPCGVLLPAAGRAATPVPFTIARLHERRVIGIREGPFDERSPEGRAYMRRLLEQARQGVVYPPEFVRRLERLLAEGGD